VSKEISVGSQLEFLDFLVGQKLAAAIDKVSRSLILSGVSAAKEFVCSEI